MSKQINIGGRFHSTEVGNVTTGANEVLDDTKGKKQNVINADVDAELLRLDQSKQNNLTFDNTPTENSNNPVKSSGVYAADKALSDAIEAILLLIPSAATALNQLADKAFVNSSVSTATATFRGTYNVVTDLELAYDASHEQIATKLGQVIATADNNDYAFVQVPVSATSTDIRRTERYKFNGTIWGYEYDLNTSGFTQAQWEAINSAITATLVQKLSALPTAQELAAALLGKQDVLTFDNVPTTDSNNPVKSGGVKSAINDEKVARENADTGLGNRITSIENVIPSAASSSNKLVDNSAMSDAIGVVTALIGQMDATFNLTTTDGHIALHVTQENGVITSVQVQSSDIASAAVVTLVTNRVTTAEGNITSLGGRVSTNETDIANLQQLYNNLQQSKPVPVTSLPSSGQQQGVIYRLAGTTSYSDYMWNGSTWVLMATYNNAIDDEPTAGSDNLVKSGGVKAALNTIDDKIEGSTDYQTDNIIMKLLSDGGDFGSGNPGISSGDATYTLDGNYAKILAPAGYNFSYGPTLVGDENNSPHHSMQRYVNCIRAHYKAVNCVAHFEFWQYNASNTYVGAIARNTDANTEGNIELPVTSSDTSYIIVGQLGVKGNSIVDNNIPAYVEFSNLRVELIEPIVTEGLRGKVEDLETEVAILEGKKTDVIDNTNAFLDRKLILDEERDYYFNQNYVSEDSYVDTSYLDQKISEVPAGKHFIFTTDPHIDYYDNIGFKQKETSIIKYVRDRLGIRNVVCGGDVIGGGSLTEYQAAKILSIYCNEKFEAFGSDFIFCIGNHDTNPFPSSDPALISDYQTYLRTARWMEHYGKAVFDDELINIVNNYASFSATEKQELTSWVKQNYYYDDNCQKIRYIVLETGDGGYSMRNLIGDGPYGSWNALYIMTKFFMNALKNVPSNYDIVIVGHWIIVDGIWWKRIFYKLMAAYKNKVSVSINAGSSVQLNNTLNNILFDNPSSLSDITVDLTQHKGSGRIFSISGHEHYDMFTVPVYVDDDSAITVPVYSPTMTFSTNSVLRIQVDRACAGAINNDLPEGATSYPDDISAGGSVQRLGTTLEVLFDVVTITDDNKVVITRIGAGDGAELRLPVAQ